MNAAFSKNSPAASPSPERACLKKCAPPGQCHDRDRRSRPLRQTFFLTLAGLKLFRPINPEQKLRVIFKNIKPACQPPAKGAESAREIKNVAVGYWNVSYDFLPAYKRS
jgi:hypothetical protein